MSWSNTVNGIIMKVTSREESVQKSFPAESRKKKEISSRTKRNFSDIPLVTPLFK